MVKGVKHKPGFPGTLTSCESPISMYSLKYAFVDGDEPDDLQATATPPPHV